MSALRMISLCSGYEGLGMAVHAVTGAELVAVSDIDKGANKILAHRFPDVPNLGDLKLIDWSAWVGVEVMLAGYPCQPFSHAGKRGGTDDPRHIFPNIAEGIRIVGPRLVVLENVRGHLALGFDTVLGTLADIGYDARWVCVRASDVGAPHRRERMFIVATPADSTGHRWYEGWTEPARLVGGLHAAKRGASLAADASSARFGQLAGGPPAQEARPGSRDLTGDRGGERPDPDWGPYRPAINRWSAVLGRPAPAPTEPGAKGQPRLSPRFVEWMQGLPDGWVTDPAIGLTRNEMLKALGNGVVPQQATAALVHLLGVRSDAA